MLQDKLGLACQQHTEITGYTIGAQTHTNPTSTNNFAYLRSSGGQVRRRIVDPETAIEKPAGMIGEIWVHGGNVSSGYWRRPVETEQMFAARLAAPRLAHPKIVG